MQTQAAVTEWLPRWDRMQDRYNPRRRERFETVLRIVSALCPSPSRVVDLGCGTGSLMVPFLDAFPGAEVVGIDMDPAMLMLAETRLRPYGSRARIVQHDLCTSDWACDVANANAVVSATALHWLEPDTLARLYGNAASILLPGGIFLNADHVGSPTSAVQQLWERMRCEAFELDADSDDWNSFWEGLDAAFGQEFSCTQREYFASCSAVEEGLPLAWHFEKLHEADFEAVDCYWRYGGDAVYGGIRSRS